MPFCDTLNYTFRGRDYLVVWGDQAWAWKSKGAQSLDQLQTKMVLDEMRIFSPIAYDRIYQAITQKRHPFAPAPQRPSNLQLLRGSSTLDLHNADIARRLRIFFKPRQTPSPMGGAQAKAETEAEESSSRETKEELDEIKVRVVRGDTNEPLSESDFQIFLTNGSTGEAAPDGEGWSKYSGLPAGTCYFKLLAKGWEASPPSD